ncbi:MAG: glycosyltransferase family 2 protein [Chloroflexota bacterium]
MSEDERLVASIIVVAYNDRKYLEACLSALLDQDQPAADYEVIYADNASTDGSADFVERHFPAVRVIRFAQNLGFTGGNNKAAEFARGRYIVFQNADTIAHRRWLSELIRAVRSDPLVKAAHPSGAPLNFGGYNERQAPVARGVKCELTRYGYVDFTENSLDGEMEPTLFIAGGSLLIDSNIHDELRYYFDPSYFIYNEDTDLGLRINNLGYKILYVPSAVCYHQRAPSRRMALNRKGLRMAYLVTRNRFITFYKNMNTLEFLLALPLIYMGSIVKLRTLPLGRAKKVIYGAGLVPHTLFALGAALLRLPAYREERAYILSRRSDRPRFWLLQELWRRPVPPRTPLTYGDAPQQPTPGGEDFSVSRA